MHQDRLVASLRHLRIDQDNYKVLKLLPLIYVAWTDGNITQARKERIVALAHDHFEIGERGEAVLRRWLEKRPTKEYFQEGLHDIFLLAHAPDEWEFDLDELHGLLAHAEAIARLTAEAVGAPIADTEAEEAALADIARELGVDNGESWAQLIRELDGGRSQG